MSVQELEAAALKLPISERARLATCLLSSLDGEPSADEAWMDLAQERYEAVSRGAMGTVPADEALARERRS